MILDTATGGCQRRLTLDRHAAASRRQTPGRDHRPGPGVLIHRCLTGVSIGHHAWSEVVETMGIEPTTPCLQIRKTAISASFGSYRIVSDCAI
jgi:hypothetical protein